MVIGCSAVPILPRQAAMEYSKITNIFLTVRREKNQGRRSLPQDFFTSLICFTPESPGLVCFMHMVQWCASKQSSNRIKIKASSGGEVNGNEQHNFLCQKHQSFIFLEKDCFL